MRLLTNNPAKRAGLEGYGLTVSGREPLPVRPNPENVRYLRTKRDRMGPPALASWTRPPRRRGPPGHGDDRSIAMAGIGEPGVTVVDAAGLTVGVVAARWHGDLTDHMVDAGGRGRAGVRGTDEPMVLRVAGVGRAAGGGAGAGPRGYDAVVALGVVIRGGTAHFDYVCRSVTDGLTRVALDTGVPVGHGVLTVRHRGAGPRPGRARRARPRTRGTRRSTGAPSADRGHPAAQSARTAGAEAVAAHRVR